MAATKKCNTCKESLPIQKFHKNDRTADGYFATCKDCSYKAFKIRQEKKKKQDSDYSQFYMPI